MSKSFWAIPDANTTKTPILLLREQAQLLNEATHGTLRAEVEVFNGTFSDKISVHLVVIAPALDNYKYVILTYTQGINIFPGLIIDNPNNKVIDIADEDSFETTLKSVLSSKSMERILLNLLSQSRVS
jgi:hypothetical protein